MPFNKSDYKKTETLSPSAAKRDRGEKKELYCLKGVQDSLMLEEDKEDEAYNNETVISLRVFPHVTMQLGELFENTL